MPLSSRPIMARLELLLKMMSVAIPLTFVLWIQVSEYLKMKWMGSFKHFLKDQTIEKTALE